MPESLEPTANCVNLLSTAACHLQHGHDLNFPVIRATCEVVQRLLFLFAVP